MSAINICLYLYLLLKPFYLNSSGLMQISDIFILIAFVLTIASLPKKTEETRKINLNLRILLIFLLFVILINSIYYGIYSDTSFLKSTLYYLFLFMGIYTFSKKIQDYKFLKYYYIIFIIDLCAQLLIYFLDIGKYYGGTRYRGTFNDPNQFAFFITLAIMYIYTLENVLNIKKRAWYAYIMAMFLIIKSASTGMILAIATFSVVQIICGFGKVKKIFTSVFNKKTFYITNIVFLILFVVLAFDLFICNDDNDIKGRIEYRIGKTINSQAVNRLVSKFDKAKDKSNFLEDRHLDKFFSNPIYILYGAGEGKWDRFGNNNGEIHSTLPSILFCYGIVPTSILMIWIYSNIKGLKLKELSVYIAILVESFTLINHRQLLLWIIIIIANLYKEENRLKTNKGE